MAFGASRFIKDILKRSKALCIVVLVLAVLGLFPMMLLTGRNRDGRVLLYLSGL